MYTIKHYHERDGFPDKKPRLVTYSSEDYEADKFSKAAEHACRSLYDSPALRHCEIIDSDRPKAPTIVNRSSGMYVNYRKSMDSGLTPKLYA